MSAPTLSRVDPEAAVYRELRAVLADNERLLARVARLTQQRDAAVRRAGELEAGLRPAWNAPLALALGRLRIDPDLRSINLDGRTARLSKRLFQIVAYLAARPDQVVPTETMASDIGLPNANAARVYMARLRPRLAEIGASPYLETYGVAWSGGGYWMSARCEQEAPT